MTDKDVLQLEADLKEAESNYRDAQNGGCLVSISQSQDTISRIVLKLSQGRNRRAIAASEVKRG